MGSGPAMSLAIAGSMDLAGAASAVPLDIGIGDGRILAIEPTSMPRGGWSAAASLCLPQERASLSPMSATLLNLDDYGLGVARSGDKCSLPARAVAEIRVGAA